MNTLQSEVPEIYCAIEVYFDTNKNLSLVIQELEEVGVYEIKVYEWENAGDCAICFAIVRYEAFLYLDEALTAMFSKIHNHLHEIKEIIKKYKGEICIDIAFYQYGTYPALEFTGENMEKIRFLEAEISIDAYDMR